MINSKNNKSTKNFNYIKAWIPLLVLTLAFLMLFTGCSSNGDEPGGTAVLSIDASAVGGEFLLKYYTVEFSKGDTVFDTTLRACKEQSIALASKGASLSKYVEGIADYYEFDHGPASGWVYYVNGESADKSSGVYKLQDGDVIEWVYVIE